MILINPKSNNSSPNRAIEPPIWCAILAQKGDGIVDLEVMDISKFVRWGEVLIVAMGSNPSASSTPKMGEVAKLKLQFPEAKITGLHPMATGEATYQIPTPQELCEVKPRWNLIDFSKYRAHNWHCMDGRDRSNYGVVYTSFGCPFNCYYCNISSLYSGITYRNPQDVVDEIGDLYETHHVRNLKVCDELFVLNPSHVNEVCDLLIERDYDLNIWAYARADTVTPKLLKKMKKAGFNWLAYGFESTSLDKGSPHEAVQMTRDAGINVLGNFMFGLPDDDYTSMTSTLEMAFDLQCEWVNFYCTMAYPGSKLYEDTPREDLPDRWEDYDQYSSSAKPLPTRYLTSEDVLEFRDNAFMSYFSNYDYQQMIKAKFGEQAVEQIGEMLKWSPRLLKV